MTFAIVVFVVVVVVDVITLLYDLWRKLSGRKTISRYVWDNPIEAWPLVLVQVIGAVALAIHLLTPPAQHSAAPIHIRLARLEVSGTLQEATFTEHWTPHGWRTTRRWSH